MKIGVMGHYFIEWTGGFDFLRMTLESLLAAGGEEHEIHLLLPVRGPRLAARLFARRVRAALLGRGPNYPSSEAVLRACSELDQRVKLAIIDRGDVPLAKYCRSAGIDVLLPSTYELPKSIRCPWIAYVGDFQHKHCPHFFTEKELAFRDKHFAHILNVAPAVIVNSRTVAKEAEEFYPGHLSRVFAMPFSADVPRVVPSDPATCQERYGLSRRYFMICNQFWFHKDHATAFRAFAQAFPSDPELMLVCTGEPSDPRDPQHVPRLRELARDLGLADRLKILGVIPKADQLGLMTGCVAVVQPTLSEGGPGGGAVFDAVGLGIRSIVSDLPVNLELADEPTVTFFKAGDATALADQLRRAMAEPAPTRSMQALVEQGRERRKHCGAVLLNAINHALALGTAPQSTPSHKTVFRKN
jgi:glycosyltransferase involved in cell wall biosynthesis